MKRLQMLVAGAGALGVLVLSGGTAGASDTVLALGSDSCVADAQGMMTMPDGMKMPVAAMPGCSAAKAATTATPAAAAPKSASAAPTAKTSTPASAAPKAAAPVKVHAGTGGQASENPEGLPMAPLGLVLAGLGVAAVAGRRLLRG